MNSPTPRKNVLAGAFPPSGSFAALPCASTNPTSEPKRRAKLWMLQDKHHCPVIGTCLAIDELVKFARRFSFAGQRHDEFALHVEAVGRASSRNEVSEALQKHLEHKYRIEIIRFARVRSDAEVLALWQSHFTRGEVAGALWAALTHASASSETRQRIYADMHMLSHQIGAGQAADAHRLNHLEQENTAARSALEQQKKQQSRNEDELRQQLQKTITERDRLRLIAEEAGALQARLEMFESGTVMIDMGRRLLSLQSANEALIVAAQRGQSLEKSLQATHDQARALAREREQLAAERDALERLLLAGEANTGAGASLTASCDGVCASCEQATQGRCVLYVGGRSTLVSQYRALAERLGIRLTHHDGGLEESLSRLPDMINSADAVICPTDCVSHAAYYQLKRQCKRNGKPCLLFKGAGVSGFAVALARLASGRISLPGAPLQPV